MALSSALIATKEKMATPLPPLPPTTTTTPSLLQFGPPTPSQVFKATEDFCYLYDRERKVPRYVIEHLHKRHAKRERNVTRERMSFYEDSSEPVLYRSTNDDYFHSGYDRGHMAPAANYKHSNDAMQSTFVLSQIAPQVGEGFNRDYWARLEHRARTLLQHYDDVWIVSGTLFLSRDNTSTISYTTIGKNRVHVPTHFYKSIVASRVVANGNGDDDERRVYHHAAFLLPNDKIPDNLPLQTFLVDQTTIDRLAGHVLLPKLATFKNVTSLCNVAVDGDDSKTLCALPPPNFWLKKKKESS